MLVVGAQGTGALGSVALGSVSWHAAAYAPCPLVVVRGETAAAHREIGIGIGIGDLDTCADAPRFAFEEASLRKASLIAVHAWHTPLAAISSAGAPLPGPDLDATAAEAARRLAGLLDDWRKKYPGVPVSQYVVRDRPSRVLVGLSIRADLVVIGRHASRSGRPGPGSVRHAVLNRALGSVAVVPSS